MSRNGWLSEKADSTSRWEKPNYPTYFFRHEALLDKYITGGKETWTEHGSKAQDFDLTVGDLRVRNAIVKYTQDDNKSSPVSGLLKINFGAPDAWFEEEEQIFVHPKDPYKVGV